MISAERKRESERNVLYHQMREGFARCFVVWNVGREKENVSNEGLSKKVTCLQGLKAARPKSPNDC